MTIANISRSVVLTAVDIYILGSRNRPKSYTNVVLCMHVKCRNKGAQM